jgi:hypothetical protein
VPGASLKWQVTGPGTSLPHGSTPVTLTGDSVTPVTDVEFAASTPGPYELRAAIVDAQGRTISENIFEFEVKNCCAAIP